MSRSILEVCALAKKDLQPGDKPDAVGEYCYRAWIMTVVDAQKAAAVPYGVSEGGTVTKPIKNGELLTDQNVAADKSARIYELKQLQNAMLAKG